MNQKSHNNSSKQGSRLRLGLLFSVNKGWMGGTYYIINLINTLSTLPPERQPDIYLLCSSDPDWQFALSNTSYPRLHRSQVNKSNKYITYFKRAVNYACRRLKLNCRIPIIRIKEEYDVVFPVLTYKQNNSRNILYWIPDFQELHLPEFFDRKTIRERHDNVMLIAGSGRPVVFSSRDALSDLKKHYSQTLAASDPELTPVYNFVVTKPEEISEDECKRILDKYGVKSGEFYFTANQLWEHKNHLTLFKAIRILKEKGHSPVLLCSGNKKDRRNPGYIRSLESFIDDNCLNDNIKLLGMIDRADQLCLMKKCKAIIQPSLFEGWSTSVEEAKAINKSLILSDLDVHKEQALDYALFFDRENSESLADAIESASGIAPKIDYDSIRKAQAELLLEIFYKASRR